jgi:hypothetical protein
MLRIRLPDQVAHHSFSLSIGLSDEGLVFLDFYREVSASKIGFDDLAASFRQCTDELSKFFRLQKEVLKKILMAAGQAKGSLSVASGSPYFRGTVFLPGS